MSKRARRPALGPSLQSLLSEASRRATADLERVLGPEGVPVEFWRVLEVLADESGRPMSALAEALSMKLPSLSKLIDRMVASALHERPIRSTSAACWSTSPTWASLACGNCKAPSGGSARRSSRRSGATRATS